MDKEKKRGDIPRPKTLIFSGNATLPENTTAKHMFGHLSIEIEVDQANRKIVDVSCTLLPSLCEKILIKALIGCKVEEGIKNAVDEIENRFFSPVKRAIIAAIEDAHRKCKDYFKEMGKGKCP